MPRGMRPAMTSSERVFYLCVYTYMYTIEIEIGVQRGRGRDRDGHTPNPDAFMQRHISLSVGFRNQDPNAHPEKSEHFCLCL